MYHALLFAVIVAIIGVVLSFIVMFMNGADVKNFNHWSSIAVTNFFTGLIIYWWLCYDNKQKYL